MIATSSFFQYLPNQHRRSKRQGRSHSQPTVVKPFSTRAENYLFHYQPQGLADAVPVIPSLKLPCSKTPPTQSKHGEEVEREGTTKREN